MTSALSSSAALSRERSSAWSGSTPTGNDDDDDDDDDGDDEDDDDDLQMCLSTITKDSMIDNWLNKVKSEAFDG